MNNCYEAKRCTQKNAGRHALVIGGSLAGLFAARVLADFFDNVTILDRDVFPVKPDHRKGVPQSYHAHALLATAFPILEQLFPGIMNDLRANGAAIASNVVPFAIVSPSQSGLVRSSPSVALCWSGMYGTESRAGRKSTSWPILKSRNYLPRETGPVLWVCERVNGRRRVPPLHFRPISSLMPVAAIRRLHNGWWNWGTKLPQ